MNVGTSVSNTTPTILPEQLVDKSAHEASAKICTCAEVLLEGENVPIAWHRDLNCPVHHKDPC
jgi:hypothetical protein